LGEARRPPMGGLGGIPPIFVFPKNNYFSLNSVPFYLGLMLLEQIFQVRESFLW